VLSALDVAAALATDPLAALGSAYVGSGRRGVVRGSARRSARSGVEPLALLLKWLLIIPHAIVLVFLWIAFVVLTSGAGFAILFTERYPRGIFDFVLGLDRWVLRVAAYAAVMRDEYPPFRLDQGGRDPTGVA
jgi:hypothetical protein